MSFAVSGTDAALYDVPADTNWNVVLRRFFQDVTQVSPHMCACVLFTWMWMCDVCKY